MRPLRGLLSASVAAILLLPIPSLALSARDCEQLSIRIVGLPEAGLAQCEVGGFGGGGDQGQGSSELIQAIGADSFFVVSHAYVGHHTYLQRRGVKDMIDGVSAFSTFGSWGEETKSGDFDVRRFDAKLADGGQQAACFGFSRYSGHVAGTTGYRHHIAGFYCDLAGQAPSDARVAELMNSLEYDF